MVKVYELARYDAMTLRVNYLGQTIFATFKGGDQTRKRARLTTADKFVQDALENDPRCGKLFNKVKQYEGTNSALVKEAVDKAKPKRVTKVKTVNEALLYFTQLGASVTGESDLETLMEQYNIEFPNLK